MRKWRTEDAAELYNVNGWGINYFGINDKGNVTAMPRKEKGPAIDLKELLDELIIRDPANQIQKVAKAQIASRVISPASMMPPGLTARST